MVTGGTSRAGHRFELDALRQHGAVYLRLLGALAEGIGTEMLARFLAPD